MSTAYIITYFTDNGTPKTGLSPTVKAIEVPADSLVINNAAMTELVAGGPIGLYYYTWSSYDETKDYGLRCDSEDGNMSDRERYRAGTNSQSSDEVKVILPSASDNAAAVLSAIIEIEGAISLQETLQYLLSQLAGVATGGGTTAITFKTPDGNATRISMNVDQLGNRSVISLTP